MAKNYIYFKTLADGSETIGIKYNDNNNIYYYNEIIFTAKDDEQIRYFYTTLEVMSEGGKLNELALVLTTQNVYVLSKTLINKDCEKYADIKCEYKTDFNINEELSKYANDILFIERSYGNYFIFKDGSIYQADN